jgi:hypothetical protein
MTLVRERKQVRVWKKLLIVSMIFSFSKGVSQTTYTGYFNAPNGVGMKTDDYFNLKPLSGVGENNSWNIYHVDGTSLFQVFPGRTAPYIAIGSGKVTDLTVSGNIALNNTSYNKQIFTNNITDFNWRIGMSNNPGFTRALTTSHVQYITSSNSAGQGFAVGVNGGLSSFEILSSTHQAFFRGHVGIGTNNPDQLIHLKGTGNNYIKFDKPSSALESGLIFSKAGTSQFYFSSAGAADALKIISTGVTNEDGNSPRMQFPFSNKNIYMVESGGNVGIGTTAPESKLHVAGGLMSLDGTSPTIYTGSGASELNRYLMIMNSPTTATPSGFKAGGVLVSDTYSYANPSKNDLIVKGKVGIGTPLTSNPNDYSLFVNGKINATGIYVNDQPLSASQWVTAGSNVYYTGAVGIGSVFTTNPNNYSLLVNGKVNATELYINDQRVVSSQWTTEGSNVFYTGVVGIGAPVNSNPNNYSLLVNGKINASQLYIGDKLVVSSQWVTSGGNVYYDGAVGIGTSLVNNPNGYKFAVNGRIGAKDVRVEKVSVTWPDYVFNKRYELPTLKEVEEYIDEHKHLQDVPSAVEIEKSGHSLGEMDAILLKKIEELTLYVIQQQKEIEALKAQIGKSNPSH